jgi:hypothetical protein
VRKNLRREGETMPQEGTPKKEEKSTPASEKAPSSDKENESSAAALAAESGAAQHQTPGPAADEQPDRVKHEIDRAMVLWTAAVAVFTFGLLVAATFQYVVMHGQQTIMQGQLNSMETDERPWVGAPEIQPETVAPGVVSFTLIFRNTGHTPTAGLWFDATIGPGDNYKWLSEGNRLCDKGKKDAKIPANRFPVFTLTPGAAWAVSSVPATDFTKINLADIAKINEPHIAGCAIYGSRLDSMIHKTVFDATLKVTDATVKITGIVAAAAD